MNKEDFIAKLVKVNTNSLLHDYGYNEVYSLTTTFTSEHEEYYNLEDLFTNFYDAECAEEYVDSVMRRSGLFGVKQVTEDIEHDASVYRFDDVFGILYNVYQDDVEELISDIIDALQEEKTNENSRR